MASDSTKISITNLKTGAKDSAPGALSRFENITVPKRIGNKQEEIRNRVHDSAELTADVLREGLFDHTRSGQLISSVKTDYFTTQGRLPNGRFTEGVYRATVTVGEGVNHSAPFFLGSGIYGAKGSIIFREGGRPMGPIKDGLGPKYIMWQSGQQPHTEIIDDAQIAANKAVSIYVRTDFSK